MAKVALVVGGGRGLGAHLSKRVAQEGYEVAVADLAEDNAKTVAAAITAGGSRAMAFTVDVCVENEVRRLVTEVTREFGRIDSLIYNVGATISAKITEFELKTFQFLLDVNLTGYFLCAREVAGTMIEQGGPGSIIVINSKTGKVGSKFNPGYSAAKFGVVGLTQSLALDLAEHNIRVNSMMLGNMLDSEMFENLIPQYALKLGIPESEVKKVYREKVPLKRGCAVEDVANAVVFYSSDKASYLTGQSVNITGGQIMH